MRSCATDILCDKRAFGLCTFSEQNEQKLKLAAAEQRCKCRSVVQQAGVCVDQNTASSSMCTDGQNRSNSVHYTEAARLTAAWSIVCRPDQFASVRAARFESLISLQQEWSPGSGAVCRFSNHSETTTNQQLMVVFWSAVATLNSWPYTATATGH